MHKTLHLTNAWHATSGGIRTFYQAMLRAAERRQQQMRMVVPGPEHAVEDVGEFGRIYYIKSPPAPLNPQYRMIFPQHYLMRGSLIPRIIEDEKPDLVEVNDKYTLMYLSGMLRERMVRGIAWRPTTVGLSCERMDQNMQYYISRRVLATRFTQLYMKWLYFPMFDHHVANSEHTAEELKTASRGHKVRRGVWIRPMGVDLRNFSPQHRHEEFRQTLARIAGLNPGDSNPRPFYLLYAGRLVPEKNLFLLTDLMECLGSDPSVHLVVAGSGPLQAELALRAGVQAPGRVHCLGHIANREYLAQLYANADAFVHPNPDEPFGIAPLEAMASGLPLIVPNHGGVLEYSTDENAWIAEPDPEAFAQAVRMIQDSPAKAERRTDAALLTARQYDWDTVADLFFDLYQEIHDLRLGIRKSPSIEPSFISSVGNYWGREQPPVQGVLPDFETR